MRRACSSRPSPYGTSRSIGTSRAPSSDTKNSVARILRVATCSVAVAAARPDDWPALYHCGTTTTRTMPAAAMSRTNRIRPKALVRVIAGRAVAQAAR
jgi:hypothetical protein